METAIRSKIKPEHLAFMSERLATVKDKLPAHREALKGDPRVKDIEKRLRWDALSASIPVAWICDNLYPYVTDEHIDNALKNILA
jgi:O-methyltransferase involved in polyketide biosynthesis